MPLLYPLMPYRALRPLTLAVLACCAAAHAQEAATEGSLPAVRIKASRAQPEGYADRGYRATTVSQVGALSARPLQDTPFSLYVIPRDLLDNVQATKPDDVLKINPLLQLNNPQSRFFSGVSMRGFGVGSNKRVDGQPNANMISVDMEDKERIEVLTGLSGFLYGPGNVGGTLNYVLKRPAAERFTTVTTGIAEGRSTYVHGDINMPLNEQFSARLNVVAQDGETATDFQSISRQLVSGALDWRLMPGLKVQLDASRGNYKMRGSNPFWGTDSATKAPYPDAPDADRYWGQPFTWTETSQDHLAARLAWALSDAVSLRAGLARRSSESALLAVNNYFTAPGGIYRSESSEWEYPDITNRAAYALADLRFQTGIVRHQATVGFFTDIDERTNYRSSAGGWTALNTGGFNTSAPRYAQALPPAPVTAKYTANRTRNSNLVLGDELTFGGQWSALVGITQSTIHDKAFAANGGTSTLYDKTRISPSVSLLYKPWGALTVYGSYIEGMEKGGTAALTYNSQPVTNAGAVMAPLVSEQFELGVKATVGGSLITAALFQIDKGLQYYERTGNSGPYTYVQSGRQVHRGLEFTSTGRVAPGWTIVGGLTLMDAKVTRNRQTPALEGKTPTNVAEQMAKVYTEYDLAAVPGLTLTGGVYYTGQQAVDSLNVDHVPAFATVDLGTRYKTQAGGVPVTLRLNIGNLANKGYWLTPSSLGAPRTVAVSAQFTF